MSPMPFLLALGTAAIAVAVIAQQGERTLRQRTEHFDADPSWHGHNNRLRAEVSPAKVEQKFGYALTGPAGKIGGLVTPAAEPAYYASTVLFGFFHANGSIRHSTAQKAQIPENFLGVAIEGPSREGFYFYPVYGTDREGETGTGVYSKDVPRIYPDGIPHDWTLRYAPGTAKAPGRITVTLDGKSTSLDLPEAHLAIGARYNRFGFVTPHIDGNGQEVFLDDLTFTISSAQP